MPILGEIHAEPMLPKAFVFDAMGYEVNSPPPGYDPNDIPVRDFHQSDARIRISLAPARSSKSYSTSPEVVFRFLPHKPLLGSLQWIIGVDYPTNKEFQYCWEWLVDKRELWTMGGHPLNITKAHNNPGNGDMIIVADYGKGPHGRARAVIEGKSASNERSLQGEHVTQWVQSEAAEHERIIWEKYGSTRSTWAIFPTTPKPKAKWLREMSEAGKRNPKLDIESFQFPWWANPLYDESGYERARIQAVDRVMHERGGDGPWDPEDDPYFAEQFCGKWSNYTGMVLPFKSHNIVTLDESWLDVSQLYLSCDYGYEDACVALFWAALPSGALLLWDEIYERHLLTHEFVQAIQDKLGDRKLSYACGDPKQPQVAHYMRDFGLNVIDVNKRAQCDRAVGHRRLVDLISIDPKLRHPMLFVAGDRCPKTVLEWEALRYKDGMTNEYGSTSLDGADHAFDAAKYFVMTFPEPTQKNDEEDWYPKFERERRQQLRESGNIYDATRGFSKWNATGRSPYGRAA